MTSTKNTAAAKKMVLEIAQYKFGRRSSLKITPVYEHGRWWVTLDDTTKDVYEGPTTFAVVETSNGLDFEPT